MKILNRDDVTIDRAKVKRLQQTVIDFYSKEGRKFPWRETTDPYVVLVSEILLQKTTSKQVLEIFRDFFNRFPTVDSLARADADEIKGFVQQLGLAKRAGFLKNLALTIVNELNSRIPSNTKDLLKLKGVGQYTANAVLCFAFNKKLPVVDSNIARVLRRYFNLK